MLTQETVKLVETSITSLVETGRISSESAVECIRAINCTAEFPPEAKLPFRLLLIEEAAAILRVTPKTIHEYFNEGELRRIKLGYRGTRVSEEDLKDFILRRTRKTIRQTSGLKAADA